MIAADVAVIGLGVQPATAFVHGAALDEAGGIAVDTQLRVAGPVFAGGDVASFPYHGSGCAWNIGGC